MKTANGGGSASNSSHPFFFFFEFKNLKIMKNIVLIVVGAFLVLTATPTLAQLRLNPVNHSGKGVTAKIENGKLVVTGTRPVNGDNCERAPATWAFELPQPPKDTTPAPVTTTTIITDNSINVLGDRNITNGSINNTGTLIQWTGDIIVNQSCPEPAPVVAPIVAPKKEWSAFVQAGPFVRILGNQGPLNTGGYVGAFGELVVGKAEQKVLRTDLVVGAEVALGPGKGTLEPEGISHCDTCGVAREYNPDDKGNGLKGNSAFYAGVRVGKEVGKLNFVFDFTIKYNGGLEAYEDGVSVGASAQAEYQLGSATSVFLNVSQRAHPWALEVPQGSFTFGGIYRF